jgi:hypothetical protein
MPSRIALAVADPKQLRQVHLKSIPAPMLKCTECDCREHVKSPFKNQCATCFHTYE